jgi:hypothetical protein
MSITISGSTNSYPFTGGFPFGAPPLAPFYAANIAASASSFLFFSSSSLYFMIFLYSDGLTILIVFIVSSQSLKAILPVSGSALY